jgi:hypothetical protein
MIIRIFSKEFYLRTGSLLWWILTFLICGFFINIFMKILWIVG